MNTIGYRGTNSFYQALSGQNNGYGVRSDNTSINLQSGEIRETGQATDLAISGSGYFILRDGGDYFYTRAGQFEFDADGFLVDRTTGFRVAALNEFGNLSDINIENYRQLNPEATTQVNFTGNLSTGSQEGSTQISVFNAQGEEIQLTFDFTNNTSTTAGSWLVSIKDENDIEIGTGEVRFAPDGSPLSGFNNISFDIPASANGSSGTAQTINLYFGEEGSFAGATSFQQGTVSTVSSNLEDGRGVEGLVAISFKEDGSLNLLYSNGDTEEPYQIALAYFNNESNLTLVDGAYYEANSSQEPQIGAANQGVYGSIVGESLESSNVDLVREFAEMIIIQRGYQASSRAMNISNQLVEQLYDNTRG